MTKVLVCGGRDFSDYRRLCDVLDKLHAQRRFAALIEGGAKGADTFAHRWALERGIEATEFTADWDRFGRAAGPIRNKQMLEEGKPDLVVAFPGGRGTASMVSLAMDANIEVIQP